MAGHEKCSSPLSKKAFEPESVVNSDEDIEESENDNEESMRNQKLSKK